MRAISSCHETPVPGKISIEKINVKYQPAMMTCFPVYQVPSHLLSHLDLTTILSCNFIGKENESQRTAEACAQLAS